MGSTYLGTEFEKAFKNFQEISIRARLPVTSRNAWQTVRDSEELMQVLGCAALGKGMRFANKITVCQLAWLAD